MSYNWPAYAEELQKISSDMIEVSKRMPALMEAHARLIPEAAKFDGPPPACDLAEIHAEFVELSARWVRLDKRIRMTGALGAAP
jgi:hypothetical protein